MLKRLGKILLLVDCLARKLPRESSSLNTVTHGEPFSIHGNKKSLDKSSSMTKSE